MDDIYEIFVEKAAKAKTPEQRKVFCETYLKKYEASSLKKYEPSSGPNTFYIKPASQKVTTQAIVSHVESVTRDVHDIETTIKSHLLNQLAKSLENYATYTKTYDPVQSQHVHRAEIDIVTPIKKGNLT
jgi:hypothetical protein